MTVLPQELSDIQRTRYAVVADLVLMDIQKALLLQL